MPASRVRVTVPAEQRLARLRTLVVDDEPLARRNLTVLLHRDSDVATVDECGSGLEAIAKIRASRPDIVFLDVQMPECDGFDVLELLGSDQPPAIIFVTAHDEYALRAFEAGAMDYLMKPFTDTRFKRALERAKGRLVDGKPARAQAPDRLIVKSAGQVVVINVAEIDWIEAASYYACLHVGSDTHVLRRSLAVLEEELEPAAFCRVHRSTIVNVRRVSRLEVTENGEYAVVLKSGTRLRLSRRFRRSVQERLERDGG
jgi:two-component system LytT family response regulator